MTYRHRPRQREGQIEIQETVRQTVRQTDGQSDRHAESKGEKEETCAMRRRCRYALSCVAQGRGIVPVVKPHRPARENM